jgi:quercetin dioxygenase-like cupin family protein
MYFKTIDELTAKSLAPGVDINSLSGEKMTMVIFSIAEGSIIPEHAHPNEQIGMILKGSLSLTVGDEEKIVKKGDFWCIPPDVPHKGHCLEGPAEVLEVFAPPRADYK